jgi:hypothetical protein
MSDIPMARERLNTLIGRLWGMSAGDVAAELKQIDALLIRQRPAHKANPRSTPMTPDIRRSIIDLSIKKPHLTQSEIAAEFGINIGRVSETLKSRKD